MGNHHTPEYKEYVAKLIVEENRVAKQLCRELDLSVGTVSGWVKKYRDKKNLSTNPKLVTPAELEKRETAYEKRIRELEEEVNILKKAMHIFSKNQV